MAIVVRSPHSGHPVKVREQDVGRAVRDEQGRVFYVVKRASGDGYYGSTTRVGSPAAEKQYDEMPAAEPATTAMPSAAEQQVAAPLNAPAPHDATGPGRPGSNLRKAILILLLLMVLAALVGYAFVLLNEGVPSPFTPVEQPEPVLPTPTEPIPSEPVEPPVLPEPMEPQVGGVLPWPHETPCAAMSCARAAA